MKLTDWLRVGIKVKRWVLLGIMGVMLILFGLVEYLNHMVYYLSYKIFWVFLNTCGVYVVYISIAQGMKSVIALINTGYINVSLDSRKLESLIYEKRLLVKGPKLAVIGGGTGLSTMLRGLKHYTSNITAIVTVGDDGGGSGALREDLGMLPPGDIRNCILALADTEPLMEELLQYRFKDGRLKNQNFGNLFLAAMDGVSSNFEEAVQKMSHVLAVTGKVVPVTLDNMILRAALENGNIVEGESNIPNETILQDSPINTLSIIPENAKAVDEALRAIEEADAIILGPGSLYTSVIPNLLVKDITKTIKKSKAIKLYVSNIMTQPGETDNYNVSDHVRAIQLHSDKDVIDYVLVNNGDIDDDMKNKYLGQGSTLVKVDTSEINKLDVGIIEGNFVKIKGNFIRHDTEQLAQMLIETIMEKKLFYDRKKIIEYFYLSGRLKHSKQNKKNKE